jgi:hypothetical protein
MRECSHDHFRRTYDPSTGRYLEPVNRSGFSGDSFS